MSPDHRALNYHFNTVTTTELKGRNETSFPPDARNGHNPIQLGQIVSGAIDASVETVMNSFTDKVSIPSHVLVRLLNKEAVLLNLETERYFGLDETGTRMWELTTTVANIESAYQQLLDEYDVDADTLRQNLSELLEKLAENGLLTMTPSDVGTASAI